MTDRILLLVDYENVTRLDPKLVDERFQVVIFLGVQQKQIAEKVIAPLRARSASVDLVRCCQQGRNALDFHIAMWLGRTFEIDRQTICIVLSRDRGYDAVLSYLNANGLRCGRIERCALLAPHQSEGSMDVTTMAPLTPHMISPQERKRAQRKGAKRLKRRQERRRKRRR